MSNITDITKHLVDMRNQRQVLSEHLAQQGVSPSLATDIVEELPLSMVEALIQSHLN